MGLFSNNKFYSCSIHNFTGINQSCPICQKIVSTFNLIELSMEMDAELWELERSLSQMTLIKLINLLKKYPRKTKIVNICNPHSYRGYYTDLAFEIGEGYCSVGEFLNMLENDCLGKEFEGYKGGLFVMSENTPLWIAESGELGEKIVDVITGRVLKFETEAEN